MKIHSLDENKQKEKHSNQKILAAVLATGIAAVGCSAKENDQAENLLSMTRQCFADALFSIDDCIEKGNAPDNYCFVKEYTNTSYAGVKEDAPNGAHIAMVFDEENSELKRMVCTSFEKDGQNEQTTEVEFRNRNTGSMLNLNDRFIKGTIKNNGKIEQSADCNINIFGNIQCSYNDSEYSILSPMPAAPVVTPYDRRGFENIIEIDKTLAHGAREVQAKIKQWQSRNNTRK